MAATRPNGQTESYSFPVDLATWTKQLADKPDARPTVQKTLRHWQTDKSGVRDPESLAKLPVEEQEAWKQLWAEVETVLKKASGKE